MAVTIPIALEGGPVLLQNPLATPHFWGLTGGSRGAAFGCPSTSPASGTGR